LDLELSSERMTPLRYRLNKIRNAVTLVKHVLTRTCNECFLPEPCSIQD